MKISSFLFVFAILNTVGNAAPSPESYGYNLPPVQSNKLRELIDSRALTGKLQKLQDFAFATKERNRYIGTPGHNATVNYIYGLFKALPKYYTAYIQPFTVSNPSSDLSIPGYGNGSVESAPMTFGPPGKITGTVVSVANVGCDAADYPSTVTGAIALISRGTCNFAVKVTLAKAAGAVGVVVYNNVPDGLVYGTLGAAGDYVPVVGITQADGIALVATTTTLTATLEVIITDILTYNVIAQTKGGDQDNIIHLGAHSDSVDAGPGINDNGSGSVGILEVALQLVKFSTKNAVRFSWWSGEEEGLLGATHFVESSTPADLSKIRLYLNFDMIASPNFKYGIYDGDGSGFNISGPAGSAEAEKLFEDYLTKIAKVNHVPSEFDGRSDYGPFLDAGIACGGLDTGAEKLKTVDEVALFGGEAGVAYDINYHGPGDQVSNVNKTAMITNTKAIAHAVAVYGESFKTLNQGKKRRAVYKSNVGQRTRVGGRWLL